MTPPSISKQVLAGYPMTGNLPVRSEEKAHAHRAGSAQGLLADEPVGVAAFQAIDRMREAFVGQLTGGLSPASLALAGFDWGFHLASAPGKQAELVWKGARKSGRLMAHLLASTVASKVPPAIEPLPELETVTAGDDLTLTGTIGDDTAEVDNTLALELDMLTALLWAPPARARHVVEALIGSRRP